MARPIFLVLALLGILSYASICRATTYTVGDTSGWDISTDVDSWAQDKHFVVGDILCQYIYLETIKLILIYYC